MNGALATPIVDAHQHYGSLAATGIDGELERARLDEWEAQERSDRLAVMDARGVDQAVIIGGHGYLRPNGVADTRTVNDGVAAYRDARPDRFVAGVAIVEPLHGEAALDELERCASELRLAGVSIHTRFQGVSLDSPWVRRILDRAGELNLVPFVHAVGESPEESLWKVDVLAQDFPELSMVVLDAFSTYEQSAMVTRVAERRPNLVFDTSLARSFTYFMPLVRSLGSDRVVYGTDLYSGPRTFEQPDLLGEILAAELADSDRAAIAGGTILRLLGRAAESGY